MRWCCLGDKDMYIFFDLLLQTSAVLPPPGLQGESWWKSSHLSQFSPAVLCRQMHLPWTYKSTMQSFFLMTFCFVCLWRVHRDLQKQSSQLQTGFAPCQPGWRRHPAPCRPGCTGWRVRCKNNCLAPPCCRERSNIYPQGFCASGPAGCHQE